MAKEIDAVTIPELLTAPITASSLIAFSEADGTMKKARADNVATVLVDPGKPVFSSNIESIITGRKLIVSEDDSGKYHLSNILNVYTGSYVTYSETSDISNDSQIIPGLYLKHINKYFKLDFSILDAKMIGVKGDGNFDNSPIVQRVLNNSNIKALYFSEGVYNFNSRLINARGNILMYGDGKSKTIFKTSTALGIIVNYAVSNTSFQSIGMSVETVSSASLANNSVIDWILDPNANGATGLIAVNNSIYNCSFSCANSEINGVKLISHRSGFGGTIKGFVIEDCDFTQIGRMGIEVLGESGLVGGNYYSGIKINRCKFINLGLKSIYGMAVSFSGDGSINSVIDCEIDGAKDVAIENSGAQFTTLQGNKFKNLAAGCVAYSVSGFDGYTLRYGNSAIDNKVLDSSGFAPQIINQSGFNSMGNYCTSGNPFILDTVFDSYISGDTYSSSNSEAVRLKNGSTRNTFSQCVIGNENGTATLSAIRNYDTATNNSFGNIVYRKSSGTNSKFITETATSYTRAVAIFDVSVGKFINYEPLSSDLLPNVDNVYKLGNPTFRFSEANIENVRTASVRAGNSSGLFIKSLNGVNIGLINNNGRQIWPGTGGGFTDVPSALAQWNSVNQGILPPRLTASQRSNDIASPPEGLTVHDSTFNVICSYDAVNGYWKTGGSYNDDAINTAQTSASLNTKYPLAPVGIIIVAKNISSGVSYKKINILSGGQWQSHLSPVV